jgi:hypothetical protein
MVDGNRGDRAMAWLGLERDEEPTVAAPEPTVAAPEPPPERVRPAIVRAEPGPWSVAWTVAAAVWLVVAVAKVSSGVADLASDGFSWWGLAVVAFDGFVYGMGSLVAVANTSWGRPWFDRPLRRRPR